MEIDFTWRAERSLREQQSCWNASFTIPWGLNCKSREFPSQGSWGPCCHRVTPFLSTGWCQLRQMKGHLCLRGDEKQRGLPERVSAYFGWKLRGTDSSKGNRHTGRQCPRRSWELCFYTAAVSAIGCARNILQSPLLIHRDLIADPHPWQAVRSRREQKRLTLCFNPTWETVPCPQQGEGSQDTRPPPCKPPRTQSCGCSVSCAGHAQGPQCQPQHGPVCCTPRTGDPSFCQLIPPVGSGTFSPRQARSTSGCHTSPALAQCSQNQRTWTHRFQT